MVVSHSESLAISAATGSVDAVQAMVDDPARASTTWSPMTPQQDQPDARRSGHYLADSATDSINREARYRPQQ